MKVMAIAFSTQGCRTLLRLKGMFEDIELYAMAFSDESAIGIHIYVRSLLTRPLTSYLIPTL